MTVAVAAFLLASCGGGGGGGTEPTTPRVTSVSAGTPKYSQKLLFTVSGTDLDKGLVVSAPGCTGMTLSTTAPNISTSTVAYYQCTVSAVGPSLVSVATTGGSTLATAPYTVPSPKVMMNVSNGAGVAGAIVFTLDPAKTPITVDNFLGYVNSGFYVGTIFHRVVAGFVVQGGGFLPLASGAAPVAKATNAPIKLEVGRGLSNVQWSAAMARTNVVDSATSQFFINLVDNSAFLDPSAVSAGYAIFGSVSAGTNVVAAIVGAPCAPITNFSECAPNPNMVITSAVQTE
jgi:cyclophilin family peptidyl-prolyl cis-trans isomerase